MIDYIDGLLDKAPEDMAGTAVTPTANDLFTMQEDATQIDKKKQAETFHHLTAKILCPREPILTSYQQSHSSPHELEEAQKMHQILMRKQTFSANTGSGARPCDQVVCGCIICGPP